MNTSQQVILAGITSIANILGEPVSLRESVTWNIISQPVDKLNEIAKKASDMIPGCWEVIIKPKMSNKKREHSELVIEFNKSGPYEYQYSDVHITLHYEKKGVPSTSHLSYVDNNTRLRHTVDFDILLYRSVTDASQGKHPYAVSFKLKQNLSTSSGNIGGIPVTEIIKSGGYVLDQLVKQFYYKKVLRQAGGNYLINIKVKNIPEDNKSIHVSLIVGYVLENNIVVDSDFKELKENYGSYDNNFEIIQSLIKNTFTEDVYAKYQDQLKNGISFKGINYQLSTDNTLHITKSSNLSGGMSYRNKYIKYKTKYVMQSLIIK